MNTQERINKAKELALQMQKYKVGQTITDGKITIKIDKVYHIVKNGYEEPMIAYEGKQVVNKKDKSIPGRFTIFQQNVK